MIHVNLLYDNVVHVASLKVGSVMADSKGRLKAMVLGDSKQ